MTTEPAEGGKLTVAMDELSVTLGSEETARELIRQGLVQRFGDLLRPTILPTVGPIVPPIVDAMAEDVKNNASGLPLFANRCQSRANSLTAISNALAAFTGLAIWATLQESPAWWAKALVALVALLSAVLGFLPTIYHWGENAAKARNLASDYGHLYGDLLNVKGKILKGEHVDDETIEKHRATLEALKKQRQEINAEWPVPQAGAAKS